MVTLNWSHESAAPTIAGEPATMPGMADVAVVVNGTATTFAIFDGIAESRATTSTW